MSYSTVMLIFGIIIGILGAYMIYQAQKMRSTGDVPEMFVSSQEMERCVNQRAFVQFLFPKVLAFGIVDLLFGIETLYDSVYSLSNAVNGAVIVIFLFAWGWFSYCLRKGREEYFR